MSSGRVGGWTGAVVPDVIGCCVSSDVWSYYRKYCLSDCVPTVYEVADCVAKANFSSSELLKEVIVVMSSSTAREMTL